MTEKRYALTLTLTAKNAQVATETGWRDEWPLDSVPPWVLEIASHCLRKDAEACKWLEDQLLEEGNPE